jgi:molecular chaperone GrpE
MKETNPKDLAGQHPQAAEGAPGAAPDDQPAGAAPGELELKTAELERTVAQLTDQLLRKAAEFENYKKRVESEYGDRIRMANEDLLLELLPVIDDFERSLKTIGPAGESEGFLRGVELIYQKLVKVLSAPGLKHYEVAGKPFDTYYHDALLLVPRADVPPHTVVEEVEKGYMLHGNVLRHAKVIVSSEATSDENPRAEGTSERAGTTTQGPP